MQLDVHDTMRRMERAYDSIARNKAIPETEKQKILSFDEFLAAKQIGEQRRLVYLLMLPRIRVSLQKNLSRIQTGHRQANGESGDARPRRVDETHVPCGDEEVSNVELFMN